MPLSAHDLDTIFADPSFRALPVHQKIAYLSNLDENFKALPPNEQVNVVFYKLNPGAQKELDTRLQQRVGEDPEARARYRQAFGQEPPPGWPHGGFGGGLEEISGALTGVGLPGFARALTTAPARTALGVASGAGADYVLRKLGLPAPIPEIGGTATGMLVGGPSARNLLQRGVRGFAHEFFPEVFGGAEPPVTTMPAPPIRFRSPEAPMAAPPVTFRSEPPAPTMPAPPVTFRSEPPAVAPKVYPAPPVRFRPVGGEGEEGIAPLVGAPAAPPTAPITIHPASEINFTPPNPTQFTGLYQSELPLQEVGPGMQRIGMHHVVQFANDNGIPFAAAKQHFLDQGYLPDWNITGP